MTSSFTQINRWTKHRWPNKMSMVISRSSTVWILSIALIFQTTITVTRMLLAHGFTMPKSATRGQVAHPSRVTNTLSIYSLSLNCPSITWEGASTGSRIRELAHSTKKCQMELISPSKSAKIATGSVSRNQLTNGSTKWMTVVSQVTRSEPTISVAACLRRTRRLRFAPLESDEVHLKVRLFLSTR